MIKKKKTQSTLLYLTIFEPSTKKKKQLNKKLSIVEMSMSEKEKNKGVRKEKSNLNRKKRKEG